MNVKELIAILSKYAEDLEVNVFFEGQYGSIEESYIYFDETEDKVLISDGM